MPEFFWQSQESLGGRALRVPRDLLEWPYRLGAALHRGYYRLRPGARVELPAAVVAVGNLTVGGSGKTPTVAWLARELGRRGRKAAVLSRGVRGRRNREVNVVSDGERVLLGAADVGDEPVLLAGSLPGVPVLSGRNRAALCLRACALFGPEVLLLDDGFQHHRVARQVDLVCIDSVVGLGNRHVLPRGPLREGLGALRAADAVVWTRAPQGFDRDAAARRWIPGKPAELPQYGLQMRLRGLRELGSQERRPPVDLRGQSVGLLAAIARPDTLRRELTGLGAYLDEERIFPDHHLYRRRDVEDLSDRRLWVTTAKDAVKLPADWCAGRRVWVLEEEVEPLRSGALIDWLLAKLDEERP